MDGDSKRVLLIIGVALVLIAVIVFAMGLYYFVKTRSVSVAPESEAQTIPTAETTTPTTVEVPKILKPVVNVIETVAGVRECGADQNCFSEATESCTKAKVVVYTPKVTQVREIIGEEAGKCIITYTNIGITEFAEPYWKDLTMTCKLNPEDVSKDILTQVSQPDCSGNLWDRLKPFATG